MAHDVGRNVGERVYQRVPNASLRRQVNDSVDIWITRCQTRQRVSISEIKLSEMEITVSFQLRKARLFEPYVVIGIEIIDADDFFLAGEQRVRDMEADETGRTC